MRVFVTGTDTDVGKTIVCAWLCAGTGASYWKPVQTGTDRGDDDTATVARLSGARTYPPAYAFGAAAAPAIAAARAGARIDCARIVAPTGAALVVEGAGGALVPIAAGVTTGELVVRLGLPTIVVARAALGTINHTALTLEALRARGVRCLGVIVVGALAPETRAAIEEVARTSVLATLPRFAELARETLAATPLPAALREALQAADASSRADAEADAERSLAELDTAHVWHPFTQATLEAEPPLAIVRGAGAYLYAADGRAYFDGAASWWTNVHGHAHPVIVRAIAEQAARLDHVHFAGVTHPQAVRLAAELVAGLPPPLCRVFFSDDGSTAVEVALKIALQRERNRGGSRTRILAFTGGYHGDTFGAMSVGDDSPFTAPFDARRFAVDRLPLAATWDGDDPGEREAASLVRLDAYLAEHGSDLATMILEPLLQGAAGMRMMRAPYVRAICERGRAVGATIVFDEVFTGFGRTGKLFALESVGVVPDLLCLSKGLTGGTLPLAVTVTSDALYDDFGGDDLARALLHGHSFTANPIACAAARASLRLFARERTLDRIAALEPVHRDGCAMLAERCGVRRSRVRGSTAAFEIGDAPAAYGSAIGRRVRAAARSRGLLLRPIGATVYLLPPACASDADVRAAYEILARAIRDAT